MNVEEATEALVAYFSNLIPESRSQVATFLDDMENSTMKEQPEHQAVILVADLLEEIRYAQGDYEGEDEP